jgi:3-methyl-2-oxobutanoate hydroxymethyltransferase
VARVTIRDFQKMKDEKEPIAMLTAYDAMSARVGEMAGIPALLVGDSLGMVVQGHSTTVPVKLEHMIYHCQIVARVTEKPLIVCDLPFMTYSISTEQALANAAQLMQDGGASSVKLEGGKAFAPTVQKIVAAGIPVMGHIGLTPQSVNQFGGWRVQGREMDSARRLLDDALALQDAGAFAIVLELVPGPLATLITETLHIPTIGIGAGHGCSGQIQVFHDLLGLAGDFVPKHTKRYAELGDLMTVAISKYLAEVKEGDFPTDAQTFNMNEEVIQSLRQERAIPS